MQRFSKTISHLEEWLIVFLLAFMTLLTFSQVIARYVFNSGAVWALELTSYAFAWMVLVGSSYVIRIGAHIAVDSLVDLMPPMMRKKTAIFAVCACMVFTAIMFWGGYQYIALLFDIEIEMQDLPFLAWKATIILPLSFLLMFYRLFEVLIAIVKDEVNTLHFDSSNHQD